MIIKVPKSLKEAVIKVIGEMPKGEIFSGLDLQRRCASYYPPARKKYTETVLRTARKFCREQYRCVKRDKSFYEKVGNKVGR